MCAHREGSRGFAGYGYFFWITTKRGNIFLHPLQGSTLIKQSIISRRMVWRLFCKLRMGEQTKHSEPVVYSHGDDTSSSKAFAVITELGTIAGHETCAIEVHQHRKFLICFFCRGPHIQIKTIFAHAVRAKTHVAKNGKLHGAGTKFIGFAHTRPIWDGLWFPPAQISSWCSGEGNTPECLDAGFIHSFQCSI